MTASQQPISATSSYIIKTATNDHQRSQDVSGAALEVAREPGHDPEPILKVQDPFLYYSNDEVRMRELRFQAPPSSPDDDDSSDAGSSSFAHRSQEQQTTSCVRKTRISFELHPSLLLEDLIADDELFGGDSLTLEDILEASLLANNDQDDSDLVEIIDSLRQMMSQ
jgi:hypothetical protein